MSWKTLLKNFPSSKNIKLCKLENEKYTVCVKLSAEETYLYISKSVLQADIFSDDKTIFYTYYRAFYVFHVLKKDLIVPESWNVFNTLMDIKKSEMFLNFHGMINRKYLIHNKIILKNRIF